MAKRARICPFCHRTGITATFDTGNQLKQHIRLRHPRTPAQKREDMRTLKSYRREQIILLSKLGLEAK